MCQDFLPKLGAPGENHAPESKLTTAKTALFSRNRRSRPNRYGPTGLSVNNNSGIKPIKRYELATDRTLP